MFYNENFAVIRHLRDMNALKSYGMDGPLVPGQEGDLHKNALFIFDEVKKLKKQKVHIIYTTSVKRIKQTAQIFAQEMQNLGILTSFHDNKDLSVLDQGDLSLPADYKDGEYFQPLEKAWDAICDEAYLHDNIFYKFGDYCGKNTIYPELKDAFARTGESMGESLIKKYKFIADLLENKLSVKDDEFLVIVCQSDLPCLLLELQILLKDKSVNYTNLPVKSWEVYKKGGLQNKLGYDLPMGYTKIFNASEFIEDGGAKIIRQASEYLKEQRNALNQSIKA